VVDSEHDLHIGNHAFVLARHAERTGDLVGAVRMHRESSAAYARSARWAFAAYGASAAGAALAILGRSAEAQLELEHASEFDRHLEQPIALLAADRLVHQALVRRATVGDVDRVATDLLRGAVSRAASTGERLAELEALWHLRHTGLTGRDVARVRELATVVEGPLPSARARHVLGIATSDPELVTAAAAEAEQVGALLDAAAARADALELCSSRADGRAAATQGRALQSLLDRLDAAGSRPAPWYLERHGADTALSPRELDVANLIVQGFSRTDVATLLSISPRTVDSHLQRVYRKVGVGSRSALRRALAG
jgi:DNA-binding CsgD family transcriptional regulator